VASNCAQCHCDSINIPPKNAAITDVSQICWSIILIAADICKFSGKRTRLRHKQRAQNAAAWRIGICQFDCTQNVSDSTDWCKSCQIQSPYANSDAHTHTEIIWARHL
jgi:hypothetical protein